MILDEAGYSGNIYNPEGLREHARFVLKTLEKLKGQYEFVAVTGKSGMSVAFAALALGGDFQLVTIRKEREKSHGQLVEGIVDGVEWPAESRYVVIDDCICSGATLDRIHEALEQRAGEVKMVGCILYDQSGYENSSHGLTKQTDMVPLYQSDERPRAQHEYGPNYGPSFDDNKGEIE